MRKGPSWFNITSLALGLAFLYLPIAILVLYSFNASRLVTVWGGWSTRWYVELWHDEAMLESALVTLRIGLLSAAASTVLGTLAALALVRYGRFRGRLLFGGMIYAPLVMPEVITGLSLLLLFVAIDVDPPIRTFFTITLPLIAPAIASGFVLAFTLSLDDLILASFTTGPGATTLPIRIYSEIRLGVKPEINAVCTILIAVVAIGLVAASLTAKLSGGRRSPAPIGAQL
jgi:putrescine transport system permease protein